MNSLRIAIAFILIKAVRVPWRISEKLLKRQLPRIDHYLIMRIFQLLGRRFPVTIRYSNSASQTQLRITLQLDLCENNQLWYFRMKQHYEREWIQAISKAMNNAESFIDAGANIGVFALTIAQAYPNRSVIAVEPLPSNYIKLKRNILLNGLSNVESYKAAVADTSDSLSFYVNPIHDGGGSIIQPEDYRTADIKLDAGRYRAQHPNFVAVEQVNSLRLDDLISTRTVVKIDVEGAEVSALQSGTSALRSGLIDVMVVEVMEFTIGEVIQFLDEVEFDCFTLGKASPITTDSQIDWKIGNLLCLRRHSSIYGDMLGFIEAST